MRIINELQNQNQYSIKEIFGQNHSRKILFLNSGHKELNTFLCLKLGNQILNLSSFSRSYENLMKMSLLSEFKEINFIITFFEFYYL
jgi:hypothetical protein